MHRGYWISAPNVIMHTNKLHVSSGEYALGIYLWQLESAELIDCKQCLMCSIQQLFVRESGTKAINNFTLISLSITDGSSPQHTPLGLVYSRFLCTLLLNHARKSTQIAVTRCVLCGSLFQHCKCLTLGNTSQLKRVCYVLLPKEAAMFQSLCSITGVAFHVVTLF